MWKRHDLILKEDKAGTQKDAQEFLQSRELVSVGVLVALLSPSLGSSQLISGLSRHPALTCWR